MASGIPINGFSNKFKPKIKPCKHKDIIRNLNFKIAKDASMNTNLLKKIKNK